MSMAKLYWLVKSEPTVYSWQQLVVDGRTQWDGVRNFEARNNLRAMKENDTVFFYHSGDNKEIIGLAKVAKVAYPDPTAKGEDWSAVDLVPVKPLPRPISLATLKAEPRLTNMVLIRKPRLSVVPVTREEYDHLLILAGGE